MRLKIILLSIYLVVLPYSLMAEDAGDLRKQIFLDQKRLSIMENLVLDEQEANQFWPVFTGFQEELFEVDNDRSGILGFYVSNHQSMSDQQIENMINSMFLLTAMRRDLLEQFILKLQKEEVLPARKVLRYLQIEQNIAIIDQYSLAQKIPLIQ